MTLALVSDVGGTNARLALARDGALIAASVTRFRGQDYAQYQDVIDDFLNRNGNPKIETACIAVAGPVRGQIAALTNRGWRLSSRELAGQLGARRVRLMNDLTALGYAAPRLGPSQQSVLRPAAPGHQGNGQALVLGAGTGFNLCALRRDGDRATCLEAEAGHAALPAPVAAHLAEAGAPLPPHTSIEEVFSGRGLEALHRALGHAPLDAAQITQDPAGAPTMQVFATAAGLLLREVALHHMPLDGIWLAGSVARALAPYGAQIDAAMARAAMLRQIVGAIPLRIITDDMAALSGCIAALKGLGWPANPPR